MTPTDLRPPRPIGVRLGWISLLLLGVSVLGWGIGATGSAEADPTETPTPSATTTTTTPPTTTDAPAFDGRVSPCPSANGWRTASSGNGITATVYEYGPASVTVTVTSSGGDKSNTVLVVPGQSVVNIEFPDISASSVKNVIVQALGPGPLPVRCLLARSER